MGLNLELTKELTRPIHDRLADLKAELKHLQRSSLNGKDLADLKIKVTRFDLREDNTIDFEPRYCRPFPADEFDQIYERYVTEPDNHLQDRCPEISDESYAAAKGKSDLFNRVLIDLEAEFSGLIEDNTYWARRSVYRAYRMEWSKPGNQHLWSSEHIRHALPLPRRYSKTRAQKHRSDGRRARSFVYGDAPDIYRPGPPQPHLAASLATGIAENDEQLLSSELEVAVNLLFTHICQKPMWNFYIHPIFIYSFVGHSVRVLQLHLDGTTGVLNVRMSPFIRIDSETPLDEWTDQEAFQKNEENIKLILRWMANIPIGDTRYEDPPPEDDPESVPEHPRTPSKRALRVSE